MKRILGFLLSLIFVFSVCPFTILAADSEIIFGTEAIIVNKNADSIDIDGIKFDSAEDLEFSAVINISGCDTDYSEIHLNGKKIAKLVSGENVLTIKASELSESGNEIRILLGAGTSVYSDSTIYGSVNADDVTVDSFAFVGAGIDHPDKVNYYMPIVGASGMSVKVNDYTSGIAVGDGWSADTKLGGTTPNVPVSVGFIFDKPDTEGLFVVDTTKLTDGKKKVVFFNDSKAVGEAEYIVDNSAPTVVFSAENGANLSRLDNLTYTVEDITKIKSELYLDGKRVSSVNLRNLSVGAHTAYVSAVDEAGNEAIKVLNFNVTDRKYSVLFSDESVTMSVLGDADVMTGTLIKDIRMFENVLGEVDQNYLRSDDEVLISFDDKAELETKAVGNSLPYQSFVINTDGVKDDSVVVSYTGETGNGSDIVLKAWNYKENRWDKIADVPNGESVSVEVGLETYSYKKKMRINAVPNIVYNGSDTIVWNSDTQYYSRFEDLNEYYYKIAEYTVEQYNAGNIGYYVHTGDLVDQTNAGDEIAHAEFKVASTAQKILDDANVPNGVVSGNHDVVHTEADYSYYWQYFGEERYEDFAWYGGSLNNNMHHYDLVSIGAYDFVFLYLGYYMETQEETIAWANAVCEAYPDRNIVLCTHEYLLPSGEYSSDRSQVIWDRIVVPNENVVMVLCGHNEGVCDQLHQVGDSDRYVLEILADYQFAELGAGPQHVLNGCTCDGEGYVRIMTFNEASQLISTTYSPVASRYEIDPYNFYPSYSDSFVYDIDLIPANRSIKTTEFNVIYNSDVVGQIGDDNISLKGCEAFYATIKNEDSVEYTKIYVLNEYEVDYTPDDRPSYELPNTEKVVVSGYSNVSPNFRMGETNTFPSDEFIKVGLNLMPESEKNLYQTSGSNLYETSVDENRSVTISHEYGNSANWVTLANNIGAKIDVSEYDRIYFGVTADENAKWNLYVNFLGKEVNFSQNKDIASLFGYVNDAPSDIRGTWNGYIDLSDILNGEQTVSSIYLVTATPGQTVTFDYLFLGKSEGGAVKFVTDDTTAITYEAKIGDKIDLPPDPYKQGYIFDGWYTAKDGGDKIEDSLIASEDLKEVYAHFSENNITERVIKTYNNEINLEKPAVGKIIFVCGSLLIMAAVVIVLLLKVKKSSKK